MITASHSQLMAQYNEWMNSRLYALCAGLPDTELRKDRGAFFRSIYATLNHIAYGDLAFMSRFTGEPSVVPEPGADLFGTFDALRTQRALPDQRILAWSASLTADWLAEPLTYTSKIDGKTRTVPKWVLVTHMFNHQTHHRGQVTTLLSQMDLDVGSTDIPFMSQFDARLPVPIAFSSKSPEYGWLSNYSEDGFTLDGIHWPSVEHYYQAQKHAGTEAAERIRRADTPLKARKAGQDRSLVPRSDWNAVKEDVMRRAVRAKFEQNRRLRERLLATGSEMLIHESGSDLFWGRNREGVGDNRLGILLMEVREALRGRA